MARINPDIYSNLQIDEVWPVNTNVVKNGGIGISWSEDNKLHADTEFLCNNENRKFVEELLKLLTKELIIDQ